MHEDPSLSPEHEPASAWPRFEHRRANRLTALLNRLDPLWGAQLVVALAIGLQVALPQKLTLKPNWLAPVLEALLLIGLISISPHPQLRHSEVRRKVAIGLIGLVSAVNVFSLVLLSHYLIQGHKEKGRTLILSGAVLWLTNVLLFALWYWQLDRGGPIRRARGTELAPDFLFPQMAEPRWAPQSWRPRLTDYLYTSLTNATAFSPTDTMPLTPMAKWLMGIQALVSLTTIGLVVARAVNILS